jgi:hypothetical protein
MTTAKTQGTAKQATQTTTDAADEWRKRHVRHVPGYYDRVVEVYTLVNKHPVRTRQLVRT